VIEIAAILTVKYRQACLTCGRPRHADLSWPGPAECSANLYLPACCRTCRFRLRRSWRRHVVMIGRHFTARAGWPARSDHYNTDDQRRQSACSVIWSAFTVPYQTVHTTTLSRPYPPAGKGRWTQQDRDDIFIDDLLMALFDCDQCAHPAVMWSDYA